MIGSPPRMRGKGLWPAAGSCTRWDHPRVCGEKSGYFDLRNGVLGSPPRMRGKEEWFREMPIYSRITPAYAGKSFWFLYHCPSSGDHPRVCGEKSAGETDCCSHWGSPPRMRGKAGWSLLASVRFRITPAYAGKSFVVIVLCLIILGSPPRMRGKD